jgi:hypothetical protein
MQFRELTPGTNGTTPLGAIQHSHSHASLQIQSSIFRHRRIWKESEDKEVLEAWRLRFWKRLVALWVVGPQA